MCIFTEVAHRGCILITRFTQILGMGACSKVEKSIKIILELLLYITVKQNAFICILIVLRVAIRMIGRFCDILHELLPNLKLVFITDYHL